MDIIKITPNQEKAKSIVKMAELIEERIKCQDRKRMTALIIADYYEIIKELITALSIIEGVKTLSHKDLMDYFKEKHKRDINGQEALMIDNIRVLRNRIAYEGFFVEIDYLTRNEPLLVSLIDKIKDMIQKKLK